MFIILFGAPGVGKGTQAALMVERNNLPHFSTGDALRQAKAEQTPDGLLAAQYADRGELAPDEVIMRIVEQTLNKPAFARGALLDGFPRNLYQAGELDTILAKRNQSVDRVINIKVDEAVITKRLIERGRPDDKPDIIANRFKVYRESTEPVLNYYDGRGVTCEVDGDADVETVYNRINANIQ